MIRWLTYRLLFRAVRRENIELRAELAELQEAREAIRQRVNSLVLRNQNLHRQLVACRQRHGVT